MATADELLAMMAEDGTVYDDDICFADQDTRTVAIPERLKIIGVENDDDVAVRHFRVPAICCGTDLSAFEIRVNFENAKKERDCYFVTDAVVDGDCITFSWRVDRAALRYKGRLRFAIHMELLDADGFIEKEWNSAPAHFDVLEGLEVELTGKEEEAARAAATQLVLMLEKEGENQIAAVEAASAQQQTAIEAKGKETLASIPDDYTELHEMAMRNAAAMETKATAIFLAKHDSVVSVTDAAEQNAARVVSHIAYASGGWDGVTVQRASKNFCRLTDYNKTVSGVDIAASASGMKLSVNGTSAGAGNAYISQYFTLPPGTYTASYKIISGSIEDNITTMTLFLIQHNDNEVRLRYNEDTVTFTVSEAWADARIRFITGHADVKYSNLVLSVQIERGDAATEHVAGTADSVTLALPQTVYGGELDWSAGILTSTLDADGNALAEPETLEVNAGRLALVTGINHVWSDTGDTVLVYAADTGLYIEKVTAELSKDNMTANMYAAPVSQAWEQRMLDRIDQCLIPMPALRDVPKASSGYIKQGEIMTGVNYSAVFLAEDGKNLAGMQVPLSTYYSALENPASVMYTQDNYQDSASKSSYYGINCSGFVSYVTGLRAYTTTTMMAELVADGTWPIVPVNGENDLFSVKRGDLLLNTVVSSGNGNHVRIVRDVIHDKTTGRLIGFNLAESWKPFCKVTFYGLADFLAQMSEAQPYRVVRMDGIGAEDDTYTLAVDPIAYSRAVYPDKGDGGKYSTGEAVQLYIPDATASGITYTMGEQSVTMALSDMESAIVNDVTVYNLTGLAAGEYTISTDAAPDDPCTIIVTA